MPRLQMRRHESNCACSDCALYGTPSQLVYGTNTSGAILPNTYTVTGTTQLSFLRPCGRNWSEECRCGFCYTSLTFKHVPHEEPPVFHYTKTELPKHVPGVLEEVKKNPIINDFKRDVALNKALAFLSGLNLQNHPVKEQREQADVLREIMKVLKPERYNK